MRRKLFRGMLVWKWGFSFNEGGFFWRKLPFVITANDPNGLKLYLAVGIPFFRYGRNPGKDSYKKELFYAPIFLFRVIKK